MVTRFGSSANQRVKHLLALEQRGYETVLVRERHDRPERLLHHDNCLDVERRTWVRRLADHLLGRLGLARARTLGLMHASEEHFNRAALRAISRRIRTDRRDQDLVILVAPPHHLVLLVEHLKESVPDARIVIDWQDLWSFDEAYATRTSLPQEQLQAIEHGLMVRADLNVFTNRAAEAVVEGQLREAGLSASTASIEHAFDGELYSEKPPRPAPSAGEPPLQLTFLGSLFKPPKVPGLELVEALRGVARLGIPFVMKVVGDRMLESPQFIEQLDAGFVRPRHRMDHEDAMSELVTADWLVLLLEDLPNCHVVMHAKLAPYIQSGVPILAVVPAASYAARVVGHYDAGVVVPPGPDLARRLAAAMGTWRRGLGNDAVADRSDLTVSRFLDAWARELA